MSKKVKNIFDSVTFRELEAQYDSRASFYGKAFVITDSENNESVLYSYETKVAYIENVVKGDEEISQLVILDDFEMSNTTVRHLKEYAKQNGFRADTKKQMLKDYQVK